MDFLYLHDYLENSHDFSLDKRKKREVASLTSLLRTEPDEYFFYYGSNLSGGASTCLK